MKYGIALTRDGSHPDGNTPGSEIVGWTKNADGGDQTWDDYTKALEANDIDHGWTGYVRVYPSGVKVPDDLRYNRTMTNKFQTIVPEHVVERLMTDDEIRERAKEMNLSEEVATSSSGSSQHPRLDGRPRLRVR